ncbi:MAG: triose-phosphate isomerase [Pseudomonadota bacterium]
MTAGQSRTPLVAGNWKMNGLSSALAELRALSDRLQASPAPCDVLVCPPFTLIAAACQAAPQTPIGGQDCHPNTSGAHTGDISAEMLVDCGATAVIVGHSERRTDHGETDALVKSKAEAGLSQGLTVIVCVGETEAERDAGKTLDVIAGQVRGSMPADATPDKVIIAYEPVWAIGTGRTPSVADVEDVHGSIRALLSETLTNGANMRILYGGSVKPANASELMHAADVDGALIGGASLKAVDFDGIIDAYR